MKTIVIIPTYNEKENIKNIISAVFSNLPNSQILVVDDNSPDGTREIVKKLMSLNQNIFMLERDKKEGLGKAYTHSFKFAIEKFNPDILVMMDADLSHPPEVLPSMLDRIDEFDVIVGSRYVKGGDTVGWEFWRKALSKYGNLYARFITGIGVNDLTAGFYMIRASLLKKVDFNSVHSSGYAFQIELKNLFYKAGARFLEYPIVFKNRIGGESKISNHIIREGIIAPWKIRFNNIDSRFALCKLCQNKADYWGSKNDHKLFKCKKCNLISVNPIPEEIGVYNKDYFLGAKSGFGYTNYDSDKEPLVPVFNKYLDLLANYGKSNGKILDIGSATGFFLNIAKNRGYEVFGLEVSDFAANIANQKGIKTTVGGIDSLVFDNEYFDIVSMLDVLEHLKDPFFDLNRIKNLIKKDGLLVINTPNGESLISKILKTKWHLVVPPEHLHYFSPKNLKIFLEQNGFEVLYTKTIGKSFTLAYVFKTLFKWLNLKIFDLLAKFFSKEKFRNLSIPINLYDNFFLIAKKK